MTTMSAASAQVVRVITGTSIRELSDAVANLDDASLDNLAYRCQREIESRTRARRASNGGDSPC